jgi:hypothetical protein
VAAELSLEKSYLLVLVSAETGKDETVLQAVQGASQNKHIILTVLLDDVALPPHLAGLPLVDMRGGYKPRRLIGNIKRAELGEARIRTNQFILAFLMGVILLMFIAAVLSIAGGLIAFPQAEYETQAALSDKMVNDLIDPTLEWLMPRTTQDATYFPATVSAVSTRIRPFLAQTATAQPLNVQATLDAIATSADQTMTASAVESTTPRP